MKVTLLIPMKGHSERVPNKNLRLFNGKPLYHGIVNELMRSKFVTEIIVNTDSSLLKHDINEYFPFVSVIDRPEVLVGDFVPMNDIISYDISVLNSDIYIQTHSTNPLLTVTTLDNAIQFFLENLDHFDSIFSVTRLQSRLYWNNGKALNHNPAELVRTQDLPPIFEENSCFYIFTLDSFKNAGCKRIGLKPYLFEINKIEAMDIDEPEDFIIAEQMYKLFRKDI